MTRGLVVSCADIGSVRAGRFGWVRMDPSGGVRGSSSIRDLVASVSEDLTDGTPVALGFECPLFVPIRDDPGELTSARRGEGNRPWSAGGGAGALATGLTEVVWILREIRKSVGAEGRAFIDWPAFATEGRGLFLWEAFVSGDAKKPRGAQSHIADAHVACRSFRASLPYPPGANAIEEPSVHSLIGAAMIRSGWTKDKDMSVVGQSCLVIKS